MAVSRLYRKGAPVSIKFRIESQKEPIPNYIVDAKIYDSQGNPLSDDLRPNVAANTVTLPVPKTAIPEVGDYVALFKIYTDQDMWELPIYFAVASHEMIKLTRELPVAKLTEKSTDNELERAVTETLRLLRRHMDSHRAMTQTMNLARMKTNRDLIPKELIKKEIKSAFSKLKITVTT